MSLKLGYWKAGGLAEPLRILLHVLGQEFENITFVHPEDWLPYKQQRTDDGFDFMNIPFLEDGEVFITESAAIPYYLCKKFESDLYGKNLLDTTRVIQVNGVINDFHNAVTNQIFSEKPKEGMTEAVKEGGQYRALLAKLATYLGEKEFLLDYLTYVDIRLAYKVFFHRSVILSFGLEDPFLKHPNILKHAKRIYEHDALKGYIGTEKQFTPLDPEQLPWFKEHPLP